MVFAAAIALLCACPASAWEIVTKTRGSGITPDSQRIKSLTSATILQHSYNLGPGAWEYFTLSISSSGERHVVMFYDLNDGGVAEVVKQFRDAYNTGKKVKWCRNVDAVATGTSMWQGYNLNTIQYPVHAGNKLEVIFG